MSQTTTYCFENRFLYLCHLHNQKKNYKENLGKIFNAIHILDKNHNAFQQDVHILAANSEIVLLEDHLTRPKALFIINAEQINASSPDTLERLNAGIAALPKTKNAPKISPLANY